MCGMIWLGVFCKFETGELYKSIDTSNLLELEIIFETVLLEPYS